MRVFVLGAGRMGSVIVKDLLFSKLESLELGFGDIDLNRAQDLVKQSDSGQAFKVDVTKIDDLSQVISGYDVVVNASWYEYNLHVMKACLKAKCGYNDLGGLFHMTLQQLKLQDEAMKSEITMIVGGGESPGITNVMSYLAAEQMSSVDSVRIFCGAKDNAGEKTVFPFSVATVIDEYTKNPVEYLDEQFVELPPLSGDEKVAFPDPIGENVCHYSIHSEPATLPYSIGRGVKNVEFKLGVSEKMLKTLKPLIEIGMISENPKVILNGLSVSPKEFLISFFNSRGEIGNSLERYVALRSAVVGKIEGNESIITCDLVSGPKREWGVPNGTAYLTGVAGSIFSQLLVQGKIERRGVVPPELAVSPALFIQELAKRGIEVSRNVMPFAN